MRGFTDELRAALRGLLHSPLFTAIAIASLALGIGANAAIFSLIDQILLQSLPVERPGELVQLYQIGAHYGSNSGPLMHSYPMYKDFRDQSPVHAGLFCRRELSLSLTFNGTAERTSGELISGNYFEVLGVKPHLGRLITPADDLTKGGHPVAVLGYDYWKTRFNSDPSILGRQILVNNHQLTVIGVSSPDFFGLDPTRIVSVRIPVAMKLQMTPGWDAMDDRRSRWVQVFGRLKPGLTLTQAQAQLQTQFTNLRRMESKDAAFAQAAPAVIARFLDGKLQLQPAANGFSGLRRQVTQPLWILSGLVALVLLIACTNVANLLIARSLARRKEFAVRAALGASRWRLMRPLLVESTLLSLAGGLAGLLLAYGLNSLLLALMPTGASPLRLAATPDWRVLAFTFSVALVTGLTFGLLPALAAGRTDAAPALKAEGRGISSAASSLLRKSLVGVQVALSIVLLIAAGLFVRTLQNLQFADSGLKPERLITFQTQPSLSGYSPERIKQFARDFKQRAEATPGIEIASIGTVDKMAGNEWDSTVTVEGFRHDSANMPHPYFDAVTPGYVQAMGMRILEGRDFRDSDANTQEMQPRKATWRVCLINQKFADTYFAGRNPIGYHIGMGGDPGTLTNIEIVGVFSNAKYMDMREDVQHQILVPLYETGYPPPLVAYVRTRNDEAAAFAQLRNILREMDSNLPIYAMRSFSEQISQILSTERLLSFLASIFGLVATLLAAIGLYGVLSLAVNRRLREIGIRLALGAESFSVIKLVASEIAFLVIGGIALGLAAALLLSRYVESQLYGMSANDPLTLAIAVALLLGIATVATLLPARRATRVNPVEVLRYD